MVAGACAHPKPSLAAYRHQQRAHGSWSRPAWPLQQRSSGAARRPRPSVVRRVSQPLSSVDTFTDTASTATAVAEEAVPELLIEELPAVEVPPDVLVEFEHKLEEDLQSVAVTLTAVTGVIIFWRGVWSLLDYFLGDSIFGDICCIIAGLTIVLGIRLSGVRVSSTLWPPS